MPLTIHDVSITTLFDILTQVLYEKHNTITLGNVPLHPKANAFPFSNANANSNGCIQICKTVGVLLSGRPLNYNYENDDSVKKLNAMFYIYYIYIYII